MHLCGSRFDRTEPPEPSREKENVCPCCGVCADMYYRDEAGEIVGCESCLRPMYWYELTDEQEEY